MGQTTEQIGAALPRAPVTLPPHLDPRQSERAFEERMLPKMNQECKSDSILDRQRALHSLTDIVHAPEKIAETIQVGLYDTIGGLLMSDDDMCRNLSSEIFAVMCTHNIGRRASIRFIPNLASLFNDENVQTRVNVHKTLYCLADIYTGVVAIVNNKLVPVLINLIKTEDALVKIWIIQTLCKTLRIASEEALDSNGLDTLAELLEHDKQDSSITEHALRALAEITYPKRCKDYANKHATLGTRLVNIVTTSTIDELRAAAACTIAAMSITTEGKTKFFELGALDACCDLLTDSLSESRLNGVTAISIIGEVPKGRAYILANKLADIKKLLDDPSDLVRVAARECCDVIEWKP